MAPKKVMKTIRKSKAAAKSKAKAKTPTAAETSIVPYGKAGTLVFMIFHLAWLVMTMGSDHCMGEECDDDVHRSDHGGVSLPYGVKPRCWM
eukprot:7894344-Pyramimonas_sp.AAC.1